MDKRYQVFVSSTYEDLKEERNEVMKALLEIDCIPTAMELFPAADEDSWSLIKRVIEECDYYVLIVGGRYGSVASDGIGYTEREYRYAVEQKKPHIVFLPENPVAIQVGNTDQDEQKRIKLDAFIECVKKDRHYKTWRNPYDLSGVVSRSISQLKKTHPTIGWVRADQISDEAKSEIMRLQSKVENLQDQLEKFKTSPLDDNDLAFGESSFTLTYIVNFNSSALRRYGEKGFKKIERQITFTWDEIFLAMASCLTVPLPVITSKNQMAKLCQRKDAEYIEELQECHESEGTRLTSISLHPDTFVIIKIQFLTLGLIEEFSERPQLTDSKKILWRLTPKGMLYLSNLVTQKKSINGNVLSL